MPTPVFKSPCTPPPAPGKRLRGHQSLWLAALFCLSLPLQAATFNVNNGSDSLDLLAGNGQCDIGGSQCTLRAAIQEANALPGDDIIRLHVSNVSLSRSGRGEDASATGDLDISSNITIEGVISGTNTTITGNGLDRVFHIMDGAKVTMSNLTIVQGDVDGDIGGGIRIDHASTVSISDSIISHNRADSAQDADCNVTTIDLAPCALTEVATGGGIYVGAEATLTLSNTQVTSNTGKTAAGGIDNHGRTIVRGQSIINLNTTTGTGGGLRNFGGFFSMAESTVNNNTAAVGGGMYNSTAGQNLGNLLISNVDIHSNSASQIGAGIFNSGPMTINHSSIRDNGNPFDGGGIYNLALGNIDIYNSTISGNRATRNGGGIVTSREVNLTNVTLFGNIASASGSNPTLTVGGSQLAVLDSDPLNNENNPGIVIVNSIIANSTGDPQSTCAGLVGYASTITSIGHNIDSRDDCNFNKSTDRTFTSPRLSAITNEDPTSIFSYTYFHPLQSGSAAINTANSAYCPSVDQRFMRRNVGACDIGAYEYGASQLVSSNLVDLSIRAADDRDPVAPNNATQLLTYSFTVTNNYDADALASTVDVILPASVDYQFYTNDGVNTAISCSPPNTINTMSCDMGNVLGLSLVQVFVTVQPTEEGTITVRSEVDSAIDDAFLQNNTDEEDTLVTSDASSNISNFGAGSGGGGQMNPLLLILLLSGALFMRRR